MFDLKSDQMLQIEGVYLPLFLVEIQAGIGVTVGLHQRSVWGGSKYIDQTGSGVNMGIGRKLIFSWEQMKITFFYWEQSTFWAFPPLCMFHDHICPWTRHGIQCWREAGWPLMSGILWRCSLFETGIILQSIYTKLLAMRTYVRMCSEGTRGYLMFSLIEISHCYQIWCFMNKKNTFRLKYYLIILLTMSHTEKEPNKQREQEGAHLFV